MKGHFAAGYAATDSTLHPEAIAALLRTAWEAAGKLDLVDEVAMKDRLIGTSNLRVSEVETIGPFISLSYLPARTRITNGTSEPITYEVRGPQSPWGGPFTLKPNKSSDFPVPYPVTLRRTVADKEEDPDAANGLPLHLRPRDDAQPIPPAWRRSPTRRLQGTDKGVGGRKSNFAGADCACTGHRSLWSTTSQTK